MTTLATHLASIGAPNTPEVCAHIRKLVEQEQREDRRKRGVMFQTQVVICAGCIQFDEENDVCTFEEKRTYATDSPSWCPLREKDKE